MKMNRVACLWMFLLGVLLGMCILPARSDAALYEVGPSKPYLKLAQVPWAGLVAGDMVIIAPGTYKEKLLLSCQGTREKPVIVIGQPDILGTLPVIEGQDATSAVTNAFPYAATQNRGVVVFGLRNGQAYGEKPKYITLANLHIRGGLNPGTFVNDRGAVAQYTYNAASVFVERGEDISVQGCRISNSGNGIFVASTATATDTAQLSRRISILDCTLLDCGNVGRDREHTTYTEAEGMTISGCTYLPQRAGCLGSSTKDRSAKLVFVRNKVSGGKRQLDLVGPEGSSEYMSKLPEYRTTVVAGNEFVNGPGDAVNIIHYGDDLGVTGNSRQGTLVLLGNTFDIRRDKSETFRLVWVEATSNLEGVLAIGNTVTLHPATPGAAVPSFAVLQQAGAARLIGNHLPTTSVDFRDGIVPTGSVEYVQRGEPTPVPPVTATTGTTTPTATTPTSVRLPYVSVIGISPTSVTGGNTATAKISLSAPAPTGGFVVNLSSNTPGVGVPASVTVNEGQSSASFLVTTAPVTVKVGVTISGQPVGSTRISTVTLTVTP
jgi:hypothetical protein